MDQDISDVSLDKLQHYWSAFFSGLTVKILDKRLDIPTAMDKLDIQWRTRKDTGRLQWLATDLLDLIMKKYIPKDAYCVIGIINMDLFPKPQWTFVFGCSRIKRRTGIFSFARYDPNFANLKTPEKLLTDYKRK